RGAVARVTSRPWHSRNRFMSSPRPEADQGTVPSSQPSIGHGASDVEQIGSSALKERLLAHLKATLAAHRDTRLGEDDLRVELSQLLEKLLDDEGHSLDYAEQQTMVGEALGEVFGYGPIEGLLRDHAITDILINGPRQVYFEKSGRLQAADLAFRDEEHLAPGIRRMLAGSGRPP